MVMLGLAVILYAVMKPRERQAHTDADLSARLEYAMDQFSNELERENKKLLQLLTEMKNDSDARYRKLEEHVALLDEKMKRPDAGLRRAEQLRHTDVRHASSSHDASSSYDQHPSVSVRNRYGDLFQLHNDGKSIEYIAKKLGMNKGEVQLILTLARREDETHVRE